VTREERAAKIRADISVLFNGKQRAFLDFQKHLYERTGAA